MKMPAIAVSLQTLVLSAMLANPVLAQTSAEQQKPYEPNFETMAGFGIIPSANWRSGQFVSEKDYLNLDFDATAFTTYEGSIWHGKTGLKLGVSADVDSNLIGKLNRIMGYVGYKKFYLRVQTGKLRGNATWTGTPVPGQPQTTHFDNTYSNVDLLYWKNQNSAGGMYFGVGYTSYQLPVQLNGEILNSRNEIVYGEHAYQDNMEFKTYSFLFGFDTLNSSVMSKSDSGFGLWAYSQDRFGAGTMKISDEGKRRIEAANPGKTLVKSDIFAPVVDYDATLGVQWVKKLKNAQLGLGLGFNFAGQVVFPLGSGDLTTTAQVRATPMPYIYHYGPMLKAVLYW